MLNYHTTHDPPSRKHTTKEQITPAISPNEGGYFAQTAPNGAETRGDVLCGALANDVVVALRGRRIEAEHLGVFSEQGSGEFLGRSMIGQEAADTQSHRDEKFCEFRAHPRDRNFDYAEGYYGDIWADDPASVSKAGT
ncbi:basic leucine zipper 9 [Prunus yedoensis var. nudiflora]|uniref:Basic leucine zipper 9 n=1 Tax=Prunus yedoensis var. nudiflora TaxID=2094558 RepID=A0A314UA30_PRUYE|nr:basic leucine zipper 9 [Prunus yedoensis var. nudiflora]